MKRRSLISLLEGNGWSFARNGKEHDIYKKGNTSEAIPRHREINERLAKKLSRSTTYTKSLLLAS